MNVQTVCDADVSIQYDVARWPGAFMISPIMT